MMIFSELPIKGINREKVDVRIETNMPIVVQFGTKYKTAYGYYGHEKIEDRITKQYFIFAGQLTKERLPKTLKKIIKNLENKRYYKIK